MRDLTAFRIHIQKQVQLFNIIRIRHKVKIQFSMVMIR